MEFEWSHLGSERGDIPAKDVEESFEDPFSIRLLPEVDLAKDREARYFILGRAISGLSIFTVFWTDGKRYRIIFSRRMSPEEEAFYDRKNSEANP
ncbi:MAG: BrnT family toxin [Terrimicrobiaceae bacterium]|jgi:uncharacterized DUF497 family protein